MRAALDKLQVPREEAVIIGACQLSHIPDSSHFSSASISPTGDRMDTDILAGIQSEIRTALVLSGVTSLHDLRKFAYLPDCVFEGVGDIVPGGAAATART